MRGTCTTSTGHRTELWPTAGTVQCGRVLSSAGSTSRQVSWCCRPRRHRAQMVDGFVAFVCLDSFPFRVIWCAPHLLGTGPGGQHIGACNTLPRRQRTGAGQNVRHHSLDRLNASTIKQKKWQMVNGKYKGFRAQENQTKYHRTRNVMPSIAPARSYVPSPMH